MTKALIYCNKGLEDVCAGEVKQHIDCECHSYSEIVICTVNDIKDVCVLSYKLQSACRVCLYIGKLEGTAEENKIEELKFKEITLSNKKVAVKTVGFSNGKNETEILAKQICKEMDDQKIKYCVDLKNPEIVIYCFNSSDGIFIGVDFSKDLNKRDYLVFTHNQALRPTISYSLVQLSGFNGNGVILDPFCGSGGILIESVLCYKKGLHYFDFDKFPFHKIVDEIKYEEPKKKEKTEEFRAVGYDINLNTITSARKNAKIAAVNKEIEFSCIDVHFLDTKFDTKSVDFIVTHPPMLSKNSDEKKVLKIWDDFLFISSDILKKRLVVLLNKTEEFKELAKKYKFKIMEERTVFQGETQLFVLILEKK